MALMMVNVTTTAITPLADSRWHDTVPMTKEQCIAAPHVINLNEVENMKRGLAASEE